MNYDSITRYNNDLHRYHDVVEWYWAMVTYYMSEYDNIMDKYMTHPNNTINDNW